MDQQQMILIALAVVLVLAAAFFIYRNVRRKANDDKIRLKLREDEKLHVSLDNADIVKVAEIILRGLGGKENVVSVDNDASRLKAQIRAYDRVDEKCIRSAAVGAVLRPSKTAVHIIIGSEVEEVTAEIRKLLPAEPDKTAEAESGKTESAKPDTAEQAKTEQES